MMLYLISELQMISSQNAEMAMRMQKDYWKIEKSLIESYIMDSRQQSTHTFYFSSVFLHHG